MDVLTGAILILVVLSLVSAAFIYLSRWLGTRSGEGLRPLTKVAGLSSGGWRRDEVDFIRHGAASTATMTARVIYATPGGVFLRRFHPRRGKMVPIGTRNFFRPAGEFFPR